MCATNAIGLNCEMCQNWKVEGAGRPAAEGQDIMCSVLVTDTAGKPARKEQGVTVYCLQK